MHAGSPDEPGTGEDEHDLDVLRAKYHDYCSAQLAGLLLYLSPDEIYLLAERASRDVGGEPPAEAGWETMVGHATRWLSGKVKLPPFEVWLEDYRAHPGRYDEYLLGLWESELEVPNSG